MPSKDPDERREIARMGGIARSARYDGRAVTANATAASFTRFEREVDPDGTLPELERRRRAKAAQRLHMLQLSRKSAKARAAKKAGASR